MSVNMEYSKEEAKDWCVYMHRLKVDGRVYIGQTNSISNRWKPSAYKRCTKFYHAIQQYGWNNFEHIILSNNLTLQEANILEENYILQYDAINTGFNLTSGGLNHLLSEETKQKMSEVRKGVPKTEEHKKAISEGLKNYQRTKEHNRNNQLSQHRKPVKCIETQEIYESLSEAERQTGILSETISRCCRGKQKTASNFHWEFYEGEDLWQKN